MTEIRGPLFWLRVFGVLLLFSTVLHGTAWPEKPTDTEKPPRAEEPALLLDVYVNGTPTAQIVEFTPRGSALFARTSALRSLGLPVQAIGEGLIELGSVPGITWKLDQHAQTIYITIEPRYLPETRLRADGRGESAGNRSVQSATGLTVNYDALGTITGEQGGLNGTANVTAFSPQGAITSSWLGFAGPAGGGLGGNRAVRLDSTYQYADADSMRRYSVGDFITSGLSWTRPVHMTGAQLRSDFSTRPDLITFPLPSLSGIAAVPSTVTVLEDGNQLLSSQVQPGPFEVAQLPVVMGGGNVTMNVTNAMGEQVSVSQPFYASSEMLAPKLQTFALQTGLVRLNWGEESNDYGKLAGMALYRRGVNSKFTVESNLEGTSGTVAGGVGGIVQIGNLGVANLAVAGSAGDGHSGQQFAFGAQRIGHIFSIGASAILASKHYSDVAAMNGSPMSKSQISGNISYATKRYGTVGAVYGDLNQPLTNGTSSSVVPVATSTLSGSQRTRIVGASYNLQIRQANVYASEFHTSNSGSVSNGFQAGITIPFGHRGSATFSGTSDSSAYGIFQVQQTASDVGQWGYEGYVSSGTTPHEFGQVQYKSTYGLVTAGLDQTGATSTGRLEAQGALSLADHSVFASNEIYDSFAVVDTAEAGHVGVFEENRFAGHTNASGKLLLPDARSFEVNHVSIDPADIPVDAVVNEIAHNYRPRNLSGVVVKFNVHFGHGALLQIVDSYGIPLAVGSTATLRSSHVSVTIGYEGNAFLQDLLPHNEVDIDTPNGHCSISFTFRPTPGEIPVLGPFRCGGQHP